MLRCDIDSNAAGSYAEALEDGARRFCKMHPEESWKISGVLLQFGLSLNASDGTHHLVAETIVPDLTMADTIFGTLEAFRESKLAAPARSRFGFPT
jgi:hypothetical protein